MNDIQNKRIQTETTKRKISEAQKRRYAIINELIEAQYDALKYINLSTEARRTALRQLLGNDSVDFKTLLKSIYFIALLLSDKGFQQIIKDKT